MNVRRIMRWAATLSAVLLGILLAWLTVRLVPAFLSDNSQVDRAGYLGTMTGCIGLLVVVFQFLGWLRRRENPESIAVRLRAKTGEELDRRLGDMRRTTEDIVLAFRSSVSDQRTDLNGLVDVLIQPSARVVLTGQAGVGKSYTALQVASVLMSRDPSIVPLVIPLSRWTETEDPTSRLVRFLEAEFNLAEPSAEELLHTGRVLPIFDGLDEICAEEGTAEPASELLARFINWRISGNQVGFLVACRRSTWDQIDAGLASHYSLTVFSILGVGQDEARRYLAHSVSISGHADPADALIRALRRKGHEYLLTSPWQLSLLAEITGSQLGNSGVAATVVVNQLADLADVDSLIAHYVESTTCAGRWILARMQRALDLWWLSNYARYLDCNRVEYRAIAGHVLPARDLVLHRLWPAAGSKSPLLTDLILCVILSAPGFYWATIFLWGRGWLARTFLIVFGIAWILLLIRTSTKPWVPPATPKWSRLTDPKFFLRQLGAAGLIGTAAWVIVSPLAAIVCFMTAWLAIGLTVGFGQTLATDLQPKVVGPLGILRRERQVSRFSAASVLPVLAAGFAVTWGAKIGIAAAIIYCLVVGETVACALWRRYLAMIISSMFRLPLAPARCLDRMHALGHLRIAGMSYQFRHDDVLRYFAQRRGLRNRRSFFN